MFMFRPRTATRLSVAPQRLITRHKSSKSPSPASNVAPQPVKKGEEEDKEVKSETKHATVAASPGAATATNTTTASASSAPPMTHKRSTATPAAPYENDPYLFSRGHFTSNIAQATPEVSPTYILGIQPHPFTVKEHTGETMNDIFLHKAIASHIQPLLFSLDDRKREIPTKVHKFRNQRQIPKAENSLWVKSVLRQQTHSDMDLIPPEMLHQMVPFKPLSDVTRKLWEVKMKADFDRQQRRKRDDDEDDEHYYDGY